MNLNRKGVSPVVGTILLIGIAVIMAGTIGYFAMSQSTPEPAPVAHLSEEVEGNAICLYNDGGDTIGDAPSTLSVKLNGNTISSDNITVTGGDSDLEVGERLEISADFSRGDELTVAHKPSNTILLETTIKKSGSNQPPTADFSYSPTNPKTDETISFDGTGSDDPDGSIAKYEWDWTNDGTYEGTGSSPSHSYPDNGTYTVKLKVTDDDGATDTITKDVTVQNRKPTADADGSYTVDEGNSVDLDGTGSNDPDGSIDSYSWTITNDPTGGASLSDSDTSTPTFNAPNNVSSDTDVTVKLTVTDDDGATDSDTATVTVEDTGGCPYLYGWSGESYDLIGGSIPHAFLRRYEYRDYLLADGLREENGFFHMNIAQALPEKAWINSLGMNVVECPENTEVILGRGGKVHCIDNLEPVDAFAENGENVTPLLNSLDGNYWTSSLKGKTFENREELLDSITLSLPEEAEGSAKLIISARNSPLPELSLWSTLHYMLGTPNFDYTVGRLENDKSLIPYFDNTTQFFNSMQLQYWDGSTWVTFDRVFPAPSPNSFEMSLQAVPLNLNKMEGDRVRILAPTGLCEVDYTGIDYGENSPVTTRRIEPVEATLIENDSTRNVLESILAVDNSYTMIDRNRYINYKFKENMIGPTSDGLQRRLILTVDGYYRLEGPTVPENKMYNLSKAENMIRHPFRYLEWLLPRYAHPENYPYTEYYEDMTKVKPPFKREN